MSKRRFDLVLVAALASSLLTGCAPRAAGPPSAPDPTVETAQVGGIVLAYQSLGPEDRETVLLIAGTGMQLTGWPVELVEELVRRGYWVVRFDNRDTGLSTHLDGAGLPDAAAIDAALKAGKLPPLPYTLRDMAHDTVGLLDALGIARAHLVGVSMGGAVAQYVAIDHPQRVRSLTLMMADSGNPALPLLAKPEAFARLPPPPPPGDKEAFIEYQVRVNQVLSSPGYPTDEETLRERVRRDVERAYDPAGLARQQTAAGVDRYLPGGHRLNNLKNIMAPTVVLQGSDDPLQPVVAARDLASRIPGAELRIIRGLGHDLPLALVPAFADAITAAARRSQR